jgi:predicted AAA+ superfamily ATPase
MLYQEELKAAGIAPQQIQYYNFEDPDNLVYANAWQELYKKITAGMVPNEPNYVFLDEVQNVLDFERLVDGLYIKPGLDVYITGSNAYYLSGDLATLLTGRYVEVELYPFSFAEYMSAFSDSRSLEQHFNDYIRYGGFPKVVDFLDDPVLINEYLQGIYNTVLIKDVVKRTGIKDEGLISSVGSFLLGNIGSIVSAKRIADTLTSAGRATSHSTVERYLAAMADALLFYPLERIGIRGKKLLYKQRKLYTVDTGFCYLALGSEAFAHIGHSLENIVFLELSRRSREVKFGMIDSQEVDFVVVDRSGEKSYYQVAATVRDQSVLERELKPLQQIPDLYARTLLTLDPEEPNHQGIKQRNVIQWLLEG